MMRGINPSSSWKSKSRPSVLWASVLFTRISYMQTLRIGHFRVAYRFFLLPQKKSPRSKPFEGMCVFHTGSGTITKKKTTQFHMKSFVRGLVLKTRHVVRSNSNMANWLWCFKAKATTIKWPTTTSVSKHNELTRNRPFPGSVVSLFQNESKCETFHMKMSSACSFIFMQIKFIFIRIVSPLDSLWNRSSGEHWSKDTWPAANRFDFTSHWLSRWREMFILNLDKGNFFFGVVVTEKGLSAVMS